MPYDGEPPGSGGGGWDDEQNNPRRSWWSTRVADGLIVTVDNAPSENDARIALEFAMVSLEVEMRRHFGLSEREDILDIFDLPILTHPFCHVSVITNGQVAGAGQFTQFRGLSERPIRRILDRVSKSLRDKGYEVDVSIMKPTSGLDQEQMEAARRRLDVFLALKFN